MAKKKQRHKTEAKPAVGKKYPSLVKMIEARMMFEGVHAEWNKRKSFHIGFGMGVSEACLRAAADLGKYTPGTGAELRERELYNDRMLRSRRSYVRDENKKLDAAEQLEMDLDVLLRESRDREYDARESLKWIAANFHLGHVGPDECPHIITWNVLQTAKKFEVAFFKDFILKMLADGKGSEGDERYQEDESQLDDLRQEVMEIVAE